MGDVGNGSTAVLMNGNLRSLVTWVVGILALAGAVTATIAPMWNTLALHEREIDRIRTGIDSLQYGRTETVAKLAGVEKMFAEVETQFRAFKERMLENEGYTHERSNENQRHIEENARTIQKLGDALSRLEERSKHP